ncbi:MAG: hypothetical protein ACREA2_07510, partial [Blastocatellia bacterium]
GNGCGRGKPAPTLLLQLIFKRHKSALKTLAFDDCVRRKGRLMLRALFSKVAFATISFNNPEE